jgi:hypothetical protein
MIQLRKNPFSETSISVPFLPGETGDKLVDRALSSNGYVVNPKLLKHVNLVVNGYAVQEDMWPFCRIKESDTVVIGPRISSGDAGQIFKTVAVLAITLAVAYYYPPGATLGNALLVAGVSAAASLAFNAMIPPPGLPGIGGETSSFEGSQMYSITSQSNTAKKFGAVPKVYGTHRMFPLLAATPYTEIQADNATGAVVQYYYAIYDFGHGPLEISDVRIGDTPISHYGDAYYRLVDLNKPEEDEGSWDEVLHDNFEFYKGDVERDGTQVAIDKNENDTGATVNPPKRRATSTKGSNILTAVKHPTNPAITDATSDLQSGMVISGPGISKGTVITDITNTTITLDRPATKTNSQGYYYFTRVGDYQVTRSASDLANGSSQEIILDFVCPQGLIQYSDYSGGKYPRTIELTIEFSKEDENIWRPYNDYTYVSDFDWVGGGSSYVNVPVSVPEIEFGTTPNWGGMSVIASTKDIPVFYWGNLDGMGGGAGSPPPNYLEDKVVSSRDYTDHDDDENTPPIKLVYSAVQKIGYPKGTTQLTLTDVGSYTVGDAIFVNGVKIGTIASITASATPGFKTYTLQSPTTKAYPVYEARVRYAQEQIITGPKTVTYPAPYPYDAQWISTSNVDDKVYVRHRYLGVGKITAKTQNPHYATVRFSPLGTDQYKVRITRTTSYSTPAVTGTKVDKLSLINLTTRFDREPIRTDKRHVFMEVKIRATNQLNGTVNNLSAIAESILDVYDPDTETWSKQKTNNPAWVFCDLMTGQVNKRALDKDRLHLPSIVEWAEFCDEVPDSPPLQTFVLPRFTSNFVLDFDTTLQSLINTLTNSAQASMNIVDGKYGVLIDKLKTVPVQVFTPRNSTDFQSSRSYDQEFHALKIRFIDPEKNWDVSEAVVYDSDYTEETATLIDELSTFACTNYEQAWRYGRYMLAQSRLRKEKMSIKVDFEHLVCTRGDFVQITQDVMRAGGTPARVKSVDGTVVTIDDSLETSGALDYGYVYRGVTGIQNSTLDVLGPNEFDLHGEIPAVGDLIIIGEVDHVVFDCLVKAIIPASDMSATLELVEKADDVYLAESSDTIPVYDPQLTINVDPSTLTPAEVSNLAVVENDWRIVGNEYEYYIDVTWDAPDGATYEIFEVYVNNGQGFRLAGYSEKTEYEYIVNHNDLDIEHSVAVLAVSANGKKLPLFDVTAVTATPLEKVTAPSDVSALNINITTQVLQLDWPAVTDEDLAGYLIRYSPSEDAIWETAIPLVKLDKFTNSVSVQGRKGTYLLKAVDLNGNQSENFISATPTIPALFDLNIIEETNDFPALEGQKDTVEADEVGLTLTRLTAGGETFYSEGYYYYQELLDLGEIFTVRLQSLVEAEGFTANDLMSEWETLEEVLAMSNAADSEWDVETQFRTTDNYNVIADWNPISDVISMSAGEDELWTDWKKFTIGDATGRIFQFRLKLTSEVPEVSPRVYDGLIRADMPDRTETYNDQTAGVLGLEITYDPPFKGPGTTPNIQITQDNPSTGDYYIIENKTLAGFKITFYDNNANPVTRQFDAFVKGYGHKATEIIF